MAYQMVEHILLMVECIFVLCTTFALVIKTNTIMKEIKIAEKGENFTTVNDFLFQKEAS